VLEKSIESIQYVEEDPEKIVDISNSRVIAHTVHFDDAQKCEFSSYTSNNLNHDHSVMITRNSSNEKINSLEARLEYLNFSMLNNINSTVNFKKYIMMSENNKEMFMKKCRKKEKKCFWKSSF
jgi:hypothetical protein